MPFRIYVHECGDCPYCYEDWQADPCVLRCKHPARDDEHAANTIGENDTPPPWCPLRVEDTLVFIAPHSAFKPPTSTEGGG